MTLNKTYQLQPDPGFQLQAVDHSILNAELEEAQMAKAQQNAATLLYLKNRDQIWSTSSCAREGSDYSERLERISKDDQRTYTGEPFDDDDPMLSHPLASTNMGLYYLVTGNSQLHNRQSTSTLRWLQKCEAEISKASETLIKIKKPGCCGKPIELLETLFDKLDDVKILLESLEVDEAEVQYKTKVYCNAEALCSEIESTAKSFCI